MTMVEQITKLEIILNFRYKIVECINSVLTGAPFFPRNFFKSITFDKSKEFAGWRKIAN